MRKIRNIDVIYRIATLVVISVILLYLVYSEAARLLVHPRIDKFLVVCAIMLLIMAIYLVPDVWKRRPLDSHPFKYSFFVIAILIGIVIQAIPLSQSAVMTDRWSPDIGVSESSQEERVTVDLPRNAEDGVVYIDDTNYLHIMNIISYNPRQYVGEIIEFNGFITFRDNFPENTALLGRLLMWCCAADVVVIGAPVKFEDISVIEEFEWLLIRGEIETFMLNNVIQPVIRVINFERIEKPLSEYIYVE